RHESTTPYVYTLSLHDALPIFIPKGWWNAIELLKVNNIQMQPLENDTIIEVESYRIADYKTGNYPYEGHYPHRDTKVIKKTEKRSEEHTSELQSRENLVCRLLL